MRCALWSAVSVISACAILGQAGLSGPVPAVLLALTWGLMPRIMAFRVRKYKGWSVAMFIIVIIVLMVLGLESRLSRSAWIAPFLKTASDDMMHFTATLLLTAVLYWLGRCNSWLRVLFWTFLGAAIASCGELAQKYLSTRSAQWSDVIWDILGATAAFIIFNIIYLLRRLELFLQRKSHSQSYEHRAILPHQLPGLAEKL